MNSKNLSDFRWRTKVYLRDVLPDINKHKQGKYGFMAHFDFVIFGKSQIGTEYPVVAIELDGSEHLNDEKVQDRDKKKQEIAEDYGVKLIRIKNDFSRRYIFLRDILGTVIKESQKSKEQKN